MVALAQDSHLLSVSDKPNYELKFLRDFSEQPYISLRVILIKILQQNTMGEMINCVFQISLPLSFLQTS